ncbi:MAG: helix-turn-helix transcriptional regulator [Pseudomonadota bacterium]
MDLRNTDLPITLKTLRQEAGFTQEELAPRLGISRETLSAIETGKESTIKNLPDEVVSKWWSICRSRAREETRNCFFEQVTGYFDKVMGCFKFFNMKR